jgi:hypothetical protein
MKPFILVHQAFCIAHVNSTWSLDIYSSFVLV